MSETTQEMWTEEFKKMAKGHLSYHNQFYELGSKKGDDQSGGGRGSIQLVQPTQQQVAQAKMQIKHDLEDDEEPQRKKGKKRKLNDFKI